MTFEEKPPADIDAEAVDSDVGELAALDEEPAAVDQELPASADQENAISEGLADWLARVRRFAPGLLLGSDSARAEPPPLIPASQPTEPRQPHVASPAVSKSGQGSIERALPTSSTPALDPGLETDEAVEELQAATYADVSAHEEPVAAREPSAARAGEHDFEWPTLEEDEPAEPEYFPWPPAADREVADLVDEAEPQPEPTSREPAVVTSHVEPARTNLTVVQFASPEASIERSEAPWPAVVAPRPGSPSDWPAMEARPRRESDAFTSPITVAKQNRDFEPAERWESPWPSLPEPLPVESAGFETTIALRERDRWQRLVREQESA